MIFALHERGRGKKFLKFLRAIQMADSFLSLVEHSKRRHTIAPTPTALTILILRDGASYASISSLTFLYVHE